MLWMRRIMMDVRGLRVFRTKHMVHVPLFGSYFRVGRNVGTCWMRTKWFVVMNKNRFSLRTETLPTSLEGEVTRVPKGWESVSNRTDG